MGTEKSFTLVELLIVLGILAVIATVAVLVLNPQELIKQARDTQRMADLTTLNKALAVYQSSGQMSLGSATTVYVSIPANQTNCSDLGLPTLPSGYTYACVPSSTLQKTDSTGWIPLAFSLISYGTPLERLPIDPINTTSSGNYYTYIPGGSWELDTILESQKYRSNSIISKNNLPGVLAKGTNLSLSPVANTQGLVGYWKFDEGGGTAVLDSSTSSSNGTLINYNGLPQWVQGKVGGNALSFAVYNSVLISPSTPFTLNTFSLGLWTKTSTLGILFANGYSITTCTGGNSGWAIETNRFDYCDSTNTVRANYFSSIADNSWHHIFISVDSGTLINVYTDGKVATSTSLLGFSYAASPVMRIAEQAGIGNGITGSIDDVRLYSRVLSAAEITAIYNATK